MGGWRHGLPASKWLGAEHDRAGRVQVGPDLSVPNLQDVYVIGDTALSNGWEGNPVPGLAPAAKQGGDYVAKLLHRRIAGRPALAPFTYKHAGNLATIGRASAVADLGKVRFSGAMAWWFWGVVHVMFLGSMRNRISVAVEWMWAYLDLQALDPPDCGTSGLNRQHSTLTIWCAAVPELRHQPRFRPSR